VVNTYEKDFMEVEVNETDLEIVSVGDSKQFPSPKESPKMKTQPIKF